LAGKVIGMVVGLDLGPDFAAARAKGDMLVKEYPDQRAIMAGLLGGEIDAFAGNIDVTYYRLKAMGMTSSVVYLDRKLLTGKPSYAVLSRAAKRADKAEIIQALERALDQMSKDGTYNAIARRYLLRF
jgi:polar amino acid transport system substrate-binding protein